MKADLGLSERGYNAAMTNDYPKEAAEIKNRMDAALGKIAQRKMELESDPILVTLSEFNAKRQQEITASQKLLEADRKQAEALTKEMEKSLGQLSPSVEKLPESQRQMAMQMTSKMEIVANARKVYADALEAKNAEANSGLKLIEEQVKEKTSAVEKRKQALAMLNSQQLTVEERQQRQGLLDQKRASYENLKKTETTAYNDYFEKEKSFRKASADTAVAMKGADELKQLTDDYFNLRDKEMPQLKDTLKMREQTASAAPFPMEPKVEKPVAGVDMRMFYSVGSIAVIAVVFSLLFAFTGGRDGRIAHQYNDPQFELNFTRRSMEVEPLTGIGIRNPESPKLLETAHEETESESAVA